MAKKKGLYKPNLVSYLEDMACEQYGFSGENLKEFISTVFDYAQEKEFTSYREVDIYIDGLLTSLDIETGKCN